MEKLKNLLKSDTPTEGSSRSSEPTSQGTSGYPTTGSSNLASQAGHENPYRASSLDPRVDGGKKSDAPIVSRPSETQSYGTAQHHGTTASSTAPPPSSLTSTVNPADRSAEYGHSTSSRGLDNATSSTSASSYPATAGTGNTGTTHDTEQPSVIGQALGAVGLGGLAGSLGYASGQSEHTGTTSQPTTTTGVDSYTAPTHQGSSGHYRRESIPTTAYPSGIDSPRAINAPMGGTRSSIDQGSQQTGHSHTGTGIGAGTGAAALGSQTGHNEYERAQGVRENITGQVPSAVSTGHHQGSSGAVPRDLYDESNTLRSNVASGSTPAYTSSTPSSTTQTTGGYSSGPTLVHNAITVGDEAPITSSGLRDPTVVGHGILHPESSTAIPAYSSTQGSGKLTSTPLSGTQESGKFTSTPLQGESHTGRNTALGGATATAAGAGAYAAYEHRQGAGMSTTTPLSSTQDSGKFTSTPLRDQGYTGSDATTLGGTTATSVPRTTAATSVPYGTTQESGKFTSTPLQGESHTGRNVALGGAAATAVGAGAYGAHERGDQASHQKELEKAEKAHQKELEKEHKREEKELHREEKSHQKVLEKTHHQEEKAYQKELAAGGKKHEQEEARLSKDLDREKKPSIFKRIFKRRKNKDTGVDEDYSTDEEDTHHKGALAGAGVVGGVTGAAVAHERTTTGNTGTTGEGLNKPSYNPFSHDDPSHTTSTTARPTEPITGLPYDPSKDPKTAETLRHRSHGTGMASAVGPTDTNDLGQDRSIGTSSHAIDPLAAGSFKMGVIDDNKHGHPDASRSTETSSGTGLGQGHGYSTGTGVGTGAATHGLGHEYGHSTTTGTSTATGGQTLPYRPTNAAPGDSTQHYSSTVGQGHSGDRRLSTAETYGSPTSRNIDAPGSEPQNLAAQEMQHIRQTGEHDGVGTQVKDSFKLGGL